MKNRLFVFPRLSVPLLLALLLVAVPLAGCGDAPAEEPVVEEGDEALVLSAADVAEVERGVLSSGITLTGTLEPYREVTLNAQVPGTVARLAYDEGDRVAQGVTMAVIEARGIQSQAASARAGVAAAKAQLAQARRQLESARTLYEAGAMAELDFQAAQTQVEAAQAQLEAAQAQAATTGEQEARTTIQAPLTGGITERYVEEGESVNPGQPVYTIVSTQYLELDGQVPVEQAGQIQAGQAVEFSLSAYPGRTFRGTVARIEPTADPSTRQVSVYLRLPNQDGLLVGGLFATGRIIEAEVPDALIVPQAAVREGDGVRYVLALADGQLARREVRVVARNEEAGIVGVEGDLSDGLMVLVAPGADATAGTNVEFAAQAARQLDAIE